MWASVAWYVVILLAALTGLYFIARDGYVWYTVGLPITFAVLFALAIVGSFTNRRQARPSRTSFQQEPCLCAPTTRRSG